MKIFKSRQRGFTLLESVVVIIILAVIAALGLPSYNRMLANTKLQNKITEWRESFYYAQRESIRLKHNVKLCPSSDGENCSDAADYNVGWIIYDNTVNKLLRDYPPANGSDKFVIKLTGGNPATSNSVTFLNNGRPKDNPVGRGFEVVYNYGGGKTVTQKFRVSPSGRIIAGELKGCNGRTCRSEDSVDDESKTS